MWEERGLSSPSEPCTPHPAVALRWEQRLGDGRHPSPAPVPSKQGFTQGSEVTRAPARRFITAEFISLINLMINSFLSLERFPKPIMANLNIITDLSSTLARHTEQFIPLKEVLTGGHSQPSRSRS